MSGTDVQLYVGQATYKVGTSTQAPQWKDPGEMSGHLTFNRDYPEVDGDIYFSAKDVRANRLGSHGHPPGRALRPPGAAAGHRGRAGARRRRR